MNSSPQRIIRQGDITDVVADVVIFSSNTNLFLSGGAGASLLGVHGDPLQRAMQRALAVTGKKVAQRGGIFEIGPAETWATRFFAVVAADGFYETSKEDTRRILEQVLSRCAELPVRSVATTALGTGYGNMEIEDFTEIFCHLVIPSSIETFEMIIHGEVFYRYACRKNEELGSPARVSVDA